MKSKYIFLLGIYLFMNKAIGQNGSILYEKSEVMITMRDGIKLFTTIFSPKSSTERFPILMIRTPYGAQRDDKFDISQWSYLANMTKEGYFVVLQDCRGKFKSEGTMEIHSPLTHIENPNSTDESTDTYDTIEWLIKNLNNNSGKVGLLGISYPGWLALIGAADPHPALKASSEQACMSDLFLGDDFHHNGAFRLSYGLEYTYSVEHEKIGSDFPFPQYDLYDWYLKLGSLKNVNDLYFKKQIPTWNNFVSHPNYDTFWQKNSTLNYIKKAEVPMLHVGGYFDQEDLQGPQLMYSHMEKNDGDNKNFIILGPWNHGQWAAASAWNLGKADFQINTNEYYHILQKKWFDYWLKGKGDGNFKEANSFQTGSNKWKSYDKWPPKEAEIKKLYTYGNNTCSFEPPKSESVLTYISDPSKPVPYRPQPIEMTYGQGSRWYSWHTDDQRFAYSRPDVVSFRTETLSNDISVTGQITAHLMASTTGTDADWIVKLIDEYPDKDIEKLEMSGYQLPVAMEVFRGKFHKSFEKPTALIPNKAEEFIIDLHQINHTFKKGHKIMVQVQSTWFPVIDRNPQKYLPNIFEAEDSDYIKATQSIINGPVGGTYIELPVVK